MNDQELKELFSKMVVPKIVGSEFGSMELPIDALDEYHHAAGFSDEQLCLLHMRLPNSQDGIYNWSLDDFAPDDFAVSIEDAFFYDDKKEEWENFEYGQLFEEFVIDKLSDGNASLCGAISVDHWGRLWVSTMVTDNLGAQLCFEFNPDGAGIAVSSHDGIFSGRLWFDGEKFYYAPIYRILINNDGDSLC